MCLDQHVNWFHGCLAPFVTSKWLVCRLFTLRTKAFNGKHLIVLTSRLRGYWILIKSMRFWVRKLLLFILGSSGVWDGGLHTFKGIIRYSRRSRYPCLLKKKKNLIVLIFLLVPSAIFYLKFIEVLVCDSLWSP